MQEKRVNHIEGEAGGGGESKVGVAVGVLLVRYHLSLHVLV